MKTMTTAVVLALLAGVTLTGCGGGGSSSGGVTLTRDQLIGFWEARSLSGHGQNVTCPGILEFDDGEDIIEVECGQPGGATADVTQFLADGTLKQFTGTRQTGTGTWSLSGNRLTYTVDNTDPTIEDIAETVTITGISATQLVIRDSDAVTTTAARITR